MEEKIEKKLMELLDKEEISQEEESWVIELAKKEIRKNPVLVGHLMSDMDNLDII